MLFTLEELRSGRVLSDLDCEQRGTLYRTSAGGDMIMSTMVSAARVFTCGGGGRSDKVLHGHVLSVAVTGAISCLQ